MVQMSKIIIGLIIVGLIITVLMIFMSEMQSEYGGNVDNSSIAVYEQLGELNNLTEELEESAIEEPGAKSGFTDIVGGFLLDGFRTLGIGFKSIATLKTITDASVENTNLGGPGFANALKTSLIAIAIILVVIGVIVSAIVRRDL